jgi:hypothetical protein
LKDFEFEFEAEPTIERKKKRLLHIKSLLALALEIEDVCEDEVLLLKEEQYLLSREF